MKIPYAGAIGAVAAGALFIGVGTFVNGWWAHQRDREAELATYQASFATLKSSFDQMKLINDHNRLVANLRIRAAADMADIANQERVAAEGRASKYEGLRAEIRSTPQADLHATSPLVRHTAERLFGPPAGAPPH